MFLHHVSKEDVKILEDIFAVLTENGWVIPEWIDLLRKPY